jgi:protein gp37
MADKSKIEWIDSSWTPIRARNLATGKVGWHCEHASPGCVNCYSERQNKVGFAGGTGLAFKPGHRKDVEIFLDETMLTQPLRWRKPRSIFVCSMTDAFADFVTDEWLDRIFAICALAPQHTFVFVTKRAKRMREYITSRAALDDLGQPAEDVRIAMTVLVGTPSRREMAPALKAIPLGKFCAAGPWPLPNVVLGVSAEDQHRADERIPDLLATPAAGRIVSIEPMLGPVDLTSLTLGGDGEMDALREMSWQTVWDTQWSPEATGVPEREARESFLDWYSLSDMPTGLVHPRLDGVIVGGESGPGARPMHPGWARAIRDQCAAAGVSFFFKQSGEFGPTERGDDADHVFWEAIVTGYGKSRAGRLLDGVEHNDLPWRGAQA